MRAVAAGKWIIGFGWVEKCIQTGSIVSEVSNQNKLLYFNLNIKSNHIC